MLPRRARGASSEDLLTPLDREQTKARGRSDIVLACEDNLSFMGRLPSASMQLIVTSPPYNIGKAYERRSPLDSYVQAQKRVITECIRILGEHGSLCWQVGNHVQRGEIFPLDIVLYPIFRAHGLRLRMQLFREGRPCPPPRSAVEIVAGLAPLCKSVQPHPTAKSTRGH